MTMKGAQSTSAATAWHTVVVALEGDCVKVSAPVAVRPTLDDHPTCCICP